MESSKTDKYPNRAMELLTQSAANTLTFEQIRFGTGLFEGIALVLHRLEWYINQIALQEVIAAADSISVALTTRDDLTTIDPVSLNVIHAMQTHIRLVGPVVSMIPDLRPLVADFTTLPGSGLLIPANPLYMAVDSSSLVNPITLRLVMYYSYVRLADKDYLELLQSMIPMNI